MVAVSLYRKEYKTGEMGLYIIHFVNPVTKENHRITSSAVILNCPYNIFTSAVRVGKKIIQVIEDHNAVCDAVIFLGDGIEELDYVKARFPQLIFFAVKGNCDFFAPDDIPSEALIDIDGVKIFIAHGHKYKVKMTYDIIVTHAASIGADAVFFGHTHIPHSSCEYVGEKRIQLFNPGSIGTGYTYGVVNTSRGTLVMGLGRV